MPDIPSSQLLEIAELAEEVATHYFPSGPIDPSHIFEEKDVLVVYGSYQDAFDGLLEYRTGGFSVYCNLDRNGGRRDSPRARFTLGHELGHFFIDDHRHALMSGSASRHKSFCEFQSDLRVEKEADHFAANLLMPAGRTRKLAKPLDSGISSVLELAKAFKCSLTSTAIRCVDLNLFPAAIVGWRPDGSTWQWKSNSLREAGYWKAVTDSESLPPDSATARAFRGESAPGTGFFSNGTVAGMWFPKALPSKRERLFVEEAISLGRHGVLTLLYPFD